MIFQTQEWAPGINVTVRKGRRWDHDLGIEDVVTMSDSENDVIGHMKVVGKMVTELEKVPEGMLKSNHDPDARTFDGLLNVLQTHYDDIGPESVVTVVFFEPHVG